MDTPARPPGPRIVVIGTTGSGKTVLAGRLAARLGVPHVELDALFWGPNWTQAPAAAFRERVEQATGGEAWVADGNYTRRVLDILWPRAHTVVWLDYGLPRILWQLLRRTLGRLLGREELWEGNRESWRTTFASRDSLLLWALRTYWTHRRGYPKLFARPEHAHLTVIRLRAPREAERWLARLAGPSFPSAERRTAWPPSTNPGGDPLPHA